MHNVTTPQSLPQVLIRKGFTLIELLVVMAIIATLIALLLPSIKRSKANARSVICATNVKQMTLAIRWYTEDYDNVMVTPIDKDPPCCWTGD